MQIAPTAGGVSRRRRVRRVIAPVAVPTPVAPTMTRTFPIGEVSKAGGEWTVDWERAHADAQQVLDAIDFSKRDIVIWVPGTSNAGPHKDFAAAVRDSYSGEGSNLVALQYEATWHLRRSLPTGIATMRLVLEGIAARGGDHRVLLGGESQGAWIIGEALADPAAGRVVDRAVLLGHPWLARHQYTEGQDARVRVINHEGDQVTLPVKGDPAAGLDAMIAIRTLQLTKLGDVLSVLAANPEHGVHMLKNLVFAIPFIKNMLRNPHAYGGDMTRAVEFLRRGMLPAAAEFAQLGDVTVDAAQAAYAQLSAAAA